MMSCLQEIKTVYKHGEQGRTLLVTVQDYITRNN